VGAGTGGMMGGQGHLAGMQSMGGASMPMNPQMMGMGAMGMWMPNVNMPGAMGKGGMPMPMMQMKRSGGFRGLAAKGPPQTWWFWIWLGEICFSVLYVYIIV